MFGLVKLSLGYHEVVCMGLTRQEPEPGGSNEEKSSAMHHTYEISLVPPGEELLGTWEKTHPLHESEGMMRKTKEQLPGLILDNDTATSKEEVGILSVITEQRIVRRAYLNNRMITVEIDTCSLTSIVISEDSKLDRVIRIKRKLSA